MLSAMVQLTIFLVKGFSGYPQSVLYRSSGSKEKA